MTWHNLIGDPTGVAINFDDAVLPDGMSWRTIWGPADNGSLVLEVVPEPASLALLAFGSASLLIRRRHRV